MDFHAQDQEHPSLTAEEDNAEKTRPYDIERRNLPQRRLATVYDAVAGKVTKDDSLRNGIPNQSQRSHIVRYSTRGGPFTPDEVLFRRKDAPQRYAEHDVYNAHERDLPQGGHGVLPDSDLLKSIHEYSSRFYGAMERRNHRDLQIRAGLSGVDERSMDESALLAFGILLEEAGRDVLGRRGDLVFTEGVGLVGPDGMAGDDGTSRQPHSVVGYRSIGSRASDSKDPTAANSSKRLAKRRKLGVEPE
ncbi:hypothetical protein QQS21_008289 [Conoideocrella luteorostrata]|uniref:Uncharacterized protein n=1 Tax=Conoideocrella luteorostrata TaxID=1105319 RepID=A0AAJ0CJ95_9HYPO|nr:hypothetical protein QQS21_008289 [Conoideocrella luteorostrata]